MSTITATIDTTIGNLPPVLNHADIIDIATQDQFTTSWEAFNAALSTNTVPQMNAVGDQIDLVAEQMNIVAGEVNADKATVVAKEALMNPHYTAIDTVSANIIAVNAVNTNIVPNLTEILLADTNAATATTKAGEAAVSAQNALNSENAAAALLDSFDDRYLGAKAVEPTLDNDGNALLSGALYYNTISDTMKVYDLALATWISLSFIPTDHGGLTGLVDDDHAQYHNDARGDARYYTKAQAQEKLISGTNIKSVNGTSILGSGDLSITSVLSVEYDNRSTLRSLTPSNGDKALIKGLGLFEFVTGSTELDDDETSFATTSGRWLLQCPSYDFIEAQLGYYERLFTATAVNTIRTVGVSATVRQVVNVNGAQVGMSVSVSLDKLPTSGQVSIYGVVTEPNTVTISIANASATIGLVIPNSSWSVAVFTQN